MVIDTYPSHVKVMVGEENRRARAELRTFLIEDFITPQTIGAEIGVAWGDFSQRLLEVANPQLLHLIDPWFMNESTRIYKRHGHWKFGKTQEAFDAVHETVIKRFQKETESGQVIIHRKPSVEAAELFKDEELDWVYIDGDHAYKAILADLNSYFPKVKQGGMLLGDDYRGQGAMAVDKFISGHNVTCEHKSTVTLQYAIRKG